MGRRPNFYTGAYPEYRSAIIPANHWMSVCHPYFIPNQPVPPQPCCCRPPLPPHYMYFMPPAPFAPYPWRRR